MNRPLIAALAFCFAATGGEPGIAIQMAGGTIAEVPAKARGRMDLTNAETLVLRFEKAEVRIDYRKVNTLEYGQNVSRRYAAAIIVSPVLLLSKSRRHFVTVGYLDAAGTQQALVLRVEKGDIRAALASLEARTGRRMEYQDNEARKAGKG
jgi:hypothetical protein